MTTASLHIGKLRKPTGAPVDINGKPAAAVLTGQVFTSSDPSIFTVTPDPADPTGFILTGVAEGSASLLDTGTATEPDGTTKQIQGVMTIVVIPVPVVPPPAASIEITLGEEFDPAP